MRVGRSRLLRKQFFEANLIEQPEKETVQIWRKRGQREERKTRARGRGRASEEEEDDDDDEEEEEEEEDGGGLSGVPKYP